jgi:serine/threonine protein kinase
VIHRDLKPQNLLIGGNPYKHDQRGFRERLMYETGLVKIADFGLSKSLVLNVKRNKNRIIMEKMMGISEGAGWGDSKVREGDLRGDVMLSCLLRIDNCLLFPFPSDIYNPL